MRKTLSLLLAILIFIAGCAGHEPNPIAAYMPGDEKKSCQLLKAEMSQIQTEISTKQQEKSTKDFWNVAEFVSGFFLIIPWFFMDVKGAEKVEADALKVRNKRLMLIAAEKGCNLSGIEAVETGK